MRERKIERERRDWTRTKMKIESKKIKSKINTIILFVLSYLSFTKSKRIWINLLFIRYEACKHRILSHIHVRSDNVEKLLLYVTWHLTVIVYLYVKKCLHNYTFNHMLKTSASKTQPFPFRLKHWGV